MNASNSNLDYLLLGEGRLKDLKGRRNTGW
jgi:hypothetical protein